MKVLVVTHETPFLEQLRQALGLRTPDGEWVIVHSAATITEAHRFLDDPEHDDVRVIVVEATVHPDEHGSFGAELTAIPLIERICVEQRVVTIIAVGALQRHINEMISAGATEAGDKHDPATLAARIFEL
jgi:hypothetical protein